MSALRNNDGWLGYPNLGSCNYPCVPLRRVRQSYQTLIPTVPELYQVTTMGLYYWPTGMNRVAKGLSELYHFKNIEPRCQIIWKWIYTQQIVVWGSMVCMLGILSCEFSFPVWFFFSMHVISDKFSSRGDGVISSVNVELKI